MMGPRMAQANAPGLAALWASVFWGIIQMPGGQDFHSLRGSGRKTLLTLRRFLHLGLHGWILRHCGGRSRDSNSAIDHMVVFENRSFSTVVGKLTAHHARCAPTTTERIEGAERSL